MSSKTLQAFVFTRPGDPYSKDALGRDVIVLRNTKKFTTIRLEVENDPQLVNAKIVIFHLVERPASKANP